MSRRLTYSYMKYTIWLFASLLSIIITTGMSQGADYVPPIGAVPAETPLLRELLPILESKEMPRIADELPAMLPKPIELIDWQTAKVTQFQAKRNPDGAVVLLAYLPKGQERVAETLIYANGTEQWQRPWVRERDGVMKLVSTPRLPAGIIWTAVPDAAG